MNERQKKIDIKAVDKNLQEILGETVTQMIYNDLKCRCKIKKEDIPFRFEEFKAYLRTILGSAAEIIERQIEQDKRNEQKTR